MTKSLNSDDSIVDADGHVMEVFSSWGDYIPSARRDEVLAAQYATIAPRNQATQGLEGVSLGRADAPRVEETLLEQGFNEGADRESALNVAHEGGWESAKRIEDMDADELDVAVLYPTNMLGVVEDPEVFSIACRAYNDWLYDYCSLDRSRLVGVGVVPFQDVDAGVKEMRRCVDDLGFRAIMMRPAPYIGTRKLHDSVYDAFWQTASELGVGLGIHPFPFADLPSVTRGLRLDDGMEFPTDDLCLRQGLANALDIMVAMAWFIAGGICERFPDLQVAFLEGSGGWLPSILERLEHHFHVFGSPHQRSSPTEMFKRQCYISFDPDEAALAATADVIGADRILWASDYPHPDAKIPGIVDELRNAIDPLSPSDQQMILGTNAIRFYGL